MNVDRETKVNSGRPVVQRVARTPFHLMAKPAGPHCNMACRYCFYLEKDAMIQADGPLMSEAVLEAYIRGVAESLDSPELPYAWQGGEPTLAGLDVFRRAVDLQRRYANGRRVTNAFQTNGLLLDDAWCAFFAENGFLVGLSLDGPAALQDRYRVDPRGRGRFGEVMAAVECMKRHRVEFNTLTVVNDRNAKRPLEVYRFLRDLGVAHMQFIPIVERKPDDRAETLGLDLAPPLDPAKPGGRQAVMSWAVKPEAYGDFLCAIFDEWICHDIGRVFVQMFETALGSWMGMTPTLCIFAPRCGRALILEHNGDVYACDHFVYPDFRRGNILESPLADLVDAPAQEAFGADKELGLPDACRACPYRFACNGGCPKHRFVRKQPTDTPAPYLCAGYHRFFEHAAPWLRRMADLLRRGRPASDVMEDARRRLGKQGSTAGSRFFLAETRN